MTQVSLDTRDQVHQFVDLMLTRKFRFGDEIGAGSTIINDAIRDCLEAYPDLARRFESFRPDALALFDAMIAAGERSPTATYLHQQDEAKRIAMVEAIFLPLLPLRPLNPHTLEAIADAYRP